jgi:hypothetical protein
VPWVREIVPGCLAGCRKVAKLNKVPL